MYLPTQHLYRSASILFKKTVPHPFTYVDQYLFILPLYLNTAGSVSMVSVSRV